MPRILVCCIAFKCPFCKRENDCPLDKVDHLSNKEKFDWIKGLSKEKVKAIVEYHSNCLNKRENKL